MNIGTWFHPQTKLQALADQSIPIKDAYYCVGCHHVVFLAPHGRCRKCGSVAVQSLMREITDLEAAVQVRDELIAWLRGVVRFLRGSRHKKIFQLAAKETPAAVNSGR